MQFNVMGRACPGSCRAAFFKHKTLVFAMRVSVVYIMSGLFSMSMLLASTGKSQTLEEIKVTVELNNESLPQLFQKIQDQTSLVFGYRVQETDKVSPLTLGTQTLSVKALLDLVFTGTELKYKQVNNSVIVFEVDPEPPMSEEMPGVTEVTGRITDKAGVALPGVSVFIKGTSTGTLTDANGIYVIEAGTLTSDKVLIFSFIGYKTMEVSISTRTVVDVELEEDTKVLGEVVINGGLYETTDKLKTGSIVKVTAKDIENLPVTSPLMALQGRVAGLDITAANGTPGSAPKIRIRGTNSLRLGTAGPNQSPMVDSYNDGNLPLYIIDGTPFSSATVASMGYSGAGSPTAGGFDPLSAIGMNNIASIEVLKDGDATAIYGARGANGVILITTKKPKNNEGKTNVGLGFYQGVGIIARKVELMNTQEYVEMRKEAVAFDGGGANAFDLNSINWDTTRYTDWQELFLGGTSKITDFNTDISGGNGYTSFRLGLNYRKETYVTPGDFAYQSASGNLSVNHTSRDQKFMVSVTNLYGFDVKDAYQGDLVAEAFRLPPNAPALYDDDGNLNWAVDDMNGYFLSTWINPMSALLATTIAKKRSMVTNASVSYMLLPGLSVATDLSLTELVLDEKMKRPKTSLQPTFTGYSRDPSFSNTIFNDVKTFSWEIKPRANFSKQWGKHSVNIVAGGSLQKARNSRRAIIAENFVSDALLGSMTAAGNFRIFTDDFSEYKFCSFYNRIGYNFNNTYLLNLTLRRDGSSRFGPNNRFGNFWSVGAGWIFTGIEDIKKALPFVSFGKLRASYGIVGSDQTVDYGYYNLYNLLEEKYQGMPGFEPNALFNPDFAWAETRKIDAAIELSFFENRISTEIDWYHSISYDQLVNYILPATTGFPSVLENFDAVVQNTGWEIVLRGDPLTSNDWRWTISFNLTIPRNKLLKFDNIEDSPYVNYFKVGEPLSIQWQYTYKGVNPETGLYEMEDLNNDGLINNLDKRLMNPMDPKFFGGIVNTLQYKRFELTFLFDFKNWQNRFMLGPGPGIIRENQLVSVQNRWQQPGDITTTQRYTTEASYYTRAAASNFNISDASYFRLRSITAGYQFPATWLSKVKLQQAKIFMTGENLFRFTKFKGFDPETGYGLPPLRKITIGIQLQF